jgi:hypothetical protein
VSRHTVTCAEADSNWPIVPDWSLRRCTTGFMLAHKLSVSQCSHLALAQRHCGAVRGRARPRRLGAGTVRGEQTIFFLCGPADRPRCDRRRVWAPTVPQLARGPRGSTVLPGRRQRNHPPATPSPLLARQVRRRCATRPRRSALVDSGACSIRSGARVQLGMRKGDHDMVHGLACMRGCSLVVQRVERGSNFKNRV